MYDEPTRSRLGLDGPPKTFSAIKDFNPDHQPSWSDLVIADQDGPQVLMIMQVKGLGVLTLRASPSLDDPAGTLIFNGVGLFTKADIGYAPDL